MRFINKGTYKHVVGFDPHTGAKYEERQLAPDGQAPGVAIVNFPGHGILKAVAQGESIDLPDDLSVDVVQRACPSLEPAKVEAAPAKSKSSKDKEQ